MTAQENKVLEGEILTGPEFDEAEQKADANENKVRNGFWKTLAKASEHLPMVEETVAAYYCAFDPKTPTRVRAILLAALAYFVLPLDAIPDFLAGFGFTDDIAVLGAVLATLRSNIKQRHVDAAKTRLASAKKMTDKEPSA